MLELVERLPPGARVLDLGCGGGSFDTARRDVHLVRLDIDPPQARRAGMFVAADAARLPFPSGCFDLVISNHSLEHIAGLEACLSELGRVLRPGGAFYAAAPDAGTLQDRIYRWLGRGGGHVNPFLRPEDVTARVEQLAGLPCRSVRTLYSGFSFLNRHGFRARPPRRIALFAFGSERCLAVAVWMARAIDAWTGSRLSVYGWEFYFGQCQPPLDGGWVNVCVRCGAGHPLAYLERMRALRRGAWSYRCPGCGGWNLPTRAAGGR